MAPPPKRAKLSIEVIIIAEEDDEQADGESGRIEIEDVNVQMLYQQDIEAALGNNNHIDPEEAGQLDDTQASQTEAENVKRILTRTRTRMKRNTIIPVTGARNPHRTS